MKNVLPRAAALMMGLLGSATWATDVGVSVQVSQPGVYGRIDIGRFPQPAVIVSQPVIVAAPPPPVVVAQPRAVVVQPQPVYMWVPPGHRKNWRKHCRDYGACGVPVYFVRHDWYRQHVVVADGRREYGRDDDRGHGRGKGHGKGRGRHDD